MRLAAPGALRLVCCALLVSGCTSVVVIRSYESLDGETHSYHVESGELSDQTVLQVRVTKGVAGCGPAVTRCGAYRCCACPIARGPRSSLYRAPMCWQWSGD